MILKMPGIFKIILEAPGKFVKILMRLSNFLEAAGHFELNPWYLKLIHQVFSKKVLETFASFKMILKAFSIFRVLLEAFDIY